MRQVSLNCKEEKLTWVILRRKDKLMIRMHGYIGTQGLEHSWTSGMK